MSDDDMPQVLSLERLADVSLIGIISGVGGVGDNLKRIRRSKRPLLTQHGLEKVCGIAQSRIAKYEQNAQLPSADSLIALAKGLGCGVDDLLEGLDPEYDQLRRDTSQKTNEPVPPSTSASSIGDTHGVTAEILAVLVDTATALTEMSTRLRPFLGRQNAKVGEAAARLPDGLGTDRGRDAGEDRLGPRASDKA